MKDFKCIEFLASLRLFNKTFYKLKFINDSNHNITYGINEIKRDDKNEEILIYIDIKKGE